MSDGEHDHREESSSGVWTTMLLLLSPLIYVLSIGPVVALVEQGMLPREPVLMLYAPVIWLARNTPLAWILKWYAAQWGWH